MALSVCSPGAGATPPDLGPGLLDHLAAVLVVELFGPGPRQLVRDVILFDRRGHALCDLVRQEPEAGDQQVDLLHRWRGRDADVGAQELLEPGDDAAHPLSGGFRRRSHRRRDGHPLYVGAPDIGVQESAAHRVLPDRGRCGAPEFAFLGCTRAAKDPRTPRPPARAHPLSTPSTI